MADHPRSPSARDRVGSSGAPRDGRRSRWEGHRAERRRELIAATLVAVRRSGATVGMDAIAADSGIAKTVFYRYFADKADLHRAVGLAVADSLIHQVTTALDQEGTVRTRLAAAFDAYLRQVEADPEVYRFVVRTSPPSRSPAPADDVASVVGQHATRIIGTLLREAGADAGAAEPWGFGLVGMVRAAGDRWLEHPAMTRTELVDYLTDLVVPGFVRAVPSGTSARLRLVDAADETDEERVDRDRVAGPRIEPRVAEPRIAEHRVARHRTQK